FDRDMVAEMGDLGLIAPDLPEEFGGLGVSAVTAGMLVEEIAYADHSVSYIQLLTMLCGGLLAEFASKDVANEYLPPVIRGEKLIGLGLTEPRGGSDAANLILRAKRDGDSFVLNGEKASISAAAQADLLVVAARTGTEADGARGVTAFLVDLHSPGITRSAYNDLGSCAVGRGSIWFEDVRVPAHMMVGDEGKGFTQVMHGFDYSRALIGHMCLGPAQASMDETWPYTLEREAFGRPIAEFQGVTFPLAEYQTQMEALRLLCLKTLWLRDQGMPHTKEAAMCKWWAPKLCTDAIQQCLLTHGHLGYSRDLPHQQRMRDVMGLQIGDGTAQVSKMVIARENVGKAAVQYARR
ncbi:MAG: acyl-CoA dehydrogenase family protein, partial [Alphaproteobacteria bacterium]